MIENLSSAPVPPLEDEPALALLNTMSALVGEHFNTCAFVLDFMTQPYPEAARGACRPNRKYQLRGEIQSLRASLATRWQETLAQLGQLRSRLDRQYVEAFDACQDARDQPSLPDLPPELLAPGVPAPTNPAPARPPIPPMLLTRKPNRHSVLKNLTPEFQQEIIDYLDGHGDTAGHTLDETLAWLREKGIPTHSSSLREFCAWREEAIRLAAAETDASSYVERVCRQVPDTGLSEEHILRIGQAFFEERAVHDQDSKLFNTMMRHHHRTRALDLQQAALQRRIEAAQHRLELQERNVDCREKMADLAIWKAQCQEADKLHAAANPQPARDKGPAEEKDFDNRPLIAAMRHEMFAEIDELQASGEVVIPE